MQRLRDLPGLGPKSEQMLMDAGIESVARLRELGAVIAYIHIRRHGQVKPSLNLLYALVGALEGEHWLTIAKQQKADLIMQLEGFDQLEKLFAAEGEPLNL
ncbi:TfoX/Sxy family protein [Vibrio ruber]|uniref:DNA transformation protein TfoX n=1 Tax=Vibrio ruber (strain DSM 16370 / JCM 11486 / BCRC 17186 / CECT 7878 / LMG 23124 / VR1) TaxID=1123498 RepID=A0A1R4LKU0_VIBR1|nr:TfoX/Sxy family protein [Vibrio ruber]WNJ96587.1 TfoX/Sxy family protein [Vibrio ruber]SJN57192.1 DNA transformation protein TfoX [Vibrio ruber DSM 16370]